MRIIKSHDCVAEGAAYLAAREPRFAHALNLCAPLPLRLRPDGFGPLLRAIMGQQVSVASADAIWARLEAAGLDRAAAIIAAPEDDLRACGLSRQKMRYAYGLAGSGLDFETLRQMDSDAAIKTLTALPGIGPWTAEVYVMFSLGHADVFAPGDLALQEAARSLFDLPQRPGAKDLRDMSQDWAPWRSVAARLLWAYYAYEKRREGIG